MDALQSWPAWAVMNKNDAHTIVHVGTPHMYPGKARIDLMMLKIPTCTYDR